MASAKGSHDETDEGFNSFPPMTPELLRISGLPQLYLRRSLKHLITKAENHAR